MLELVTFSLLNGVVYGLLLFMLSSGLTLIFSMMGVLNFAHASVFMLGAYLVPFAAGWGSGRRSSRPLSAVSRARSSATVCVASSAGHVAEILFTFGLAYVIEDGDMALAATRSNRVPAVTTSLLRLGHTHVLKARRWRFPGELFLWTRSSARRGARDSRGTRTRKMAALGHDVRASCAGFALGSALAGIRGVIGARPPHRAKWPRLGDDFFRRLGGSWAAGSIPVRSPLDADGLVTTSQWRSTSAGRFARHASIESGFDMSDVSDQIARQRPIIPTAVVVMLVLRHEALSGPRETERRRRPRWLVIGSRGGLPCAGLVERLRRSLLRRWHSPRCRLSYHCSGPKACCVRASGSWGPAELCGDPPAARGERWLGARCRWAAGRALAGLASELSSARSLRGARHHLALIPSASAAWHDASLMCRVLRRRGRHERQKHASAAFRRPRLQLQLQVYYVPSG